MDIEMKVAVDTETTGLSVYKGHGPFAVVCYYENDTYDYWEFNVNPLTREIEYNEKSLDEIRDVLSHTNWSYYFHNILFDLKHLEKINVRCYGKLNDTYIAARCCYSAEPSLKLKTLAQKYVHINNDDEMDLKKQIAKLRSKAPKNFSLSNSLECDYWLAQQFKNEPNLNKKYCVLDGKRTLKLGEFYDEGMKTLKVRRTYDFHMNFFPVISSMESRGVRVDMECIVNNIKKSIEESNNIEKEVKEQLKKEKVNGFNIRSPKQVSYLLFNKLGLTPISYSGKSGEPSVDVETLKKLLELKDINEKQKYFIKKILKYRNSVTGERFSRNYLNYITEDKEETTADLLDRPHFCVHCNVNPWGAKSGRFSHSEPNLGNVADPEKSISSSLFNGREIFIVRNDYVWILMDQKQIEARIVAEDAGEKFMMKVFEEGRDIHTETGEYVKGFRGYNKDQRRKLAKHILYTKSYGGGPNALNKKYGVPIDLAKKVMLDYEKALPELKKYNTENEKFVKKHGYVFTKYNTKLYVDKDKAYIGTNYKTQGTAADIIKRAMLSIHNYFKKYKLDAHIIMQVHDELIFEIHKSICKKSLVLKIKQLMEDAGKVYKVGTPVDVSMTTTNWAEAKKVKL